MFTKIIAIFLVHHITATSMSVIFPTWKYTGMGGIYGNLHIL